MRYDVASRANQVNLILILMAYSSHYLAGILHFDYTIERIDKVNWSNCGKCIHSIANIE